MDAKYMICMHPSITNDGSCLYYMGNRHTGGMDEPWTAARVWELLARDLTPGERTVALRDGGTGEVVWRIGRS